MTADTSFPLDDATLIFLNAACEINPDSEHTELQRFLTMGARVKSATNEATGETYSNLDEALAETGEGDVPVFFVEYEKGYEPFSETHVIRCLIAEVQRLRSRLADGSFGPEGAGR